MSQRALGIAGGVLLVGGLALLIVSTVAEGRIASQPAPAAHRSAGTLPGMMPIHRGQGPGPFFGFPGGPAGQGQGTPNGANNVNGPTIPIPGVVPPG